MTTVSFEALQALGLRESDFVGDTVIDVPGGAVGMGAPQHLAALFGAALLQLFSEQLDTKSAYVLPLRSSAIDERVAACGERYSIVRFADDPRGAVVRAPGARIRSTGTVQLVGPDEVLLVSGGSNDRSWVLIDGPKGSLVIGCTDGGTLTVDSTVPPGVRALQTWSPAPEVHVDVPPVAHWTHALAIEPWLAACLASREDSPVLLDRFAVVGLLGRLWSPVTTADVAAAMTFSLEGAGPGQAGRKWWANLPEGVRNSAVQAALVQVDDLSDALPALQRLVAAEPEVAVPDLLDWLHRRDDLASLLFLAQGTLAQTVLAEALRALDEEAFAYQSQWAFVPAFNDDRLLAVASAEPDAWWGSLAEIPE